MSSIIEMSPPDHRLPRALLDAEGGFVWWYIDLLDDGGNGLVLIWSYGLPFLPGYAKAARMGSAPAPRERPSLNVAVYVDGELDCYLLQEYRPSAAHWNGEGDRWTMGSNAMATAVEEGRRRLEVHVDAPVPGTQERLIGTIELEGPARLADADDVEPGELPLHDWSPLTGPAEGVADLTFGSTRYHIRGRAYFDRNGGSKPQHDLGMDYWLWGRVPFEDRERIYYLLWPTGSEDPLTYGVDIFRDGTTKRYDGVQVARSAPRRGLAGVAYWDELSLTHDGAPWLEVRHRSIVDDGPFYMRFHVVGSREGEDALGMAEVCYPDNVDRDLHRPLVRMRVHRVGERNSMWLPLFTGPRQGRVSRLFRNILRRP